MHKKTKHINEGVDYKELVKLILNVDSKQPIYYNDSWNVVNIGGTGYDKGDLVKHFKAQPGQSSNIKNNFYYAHKDPIVTKTQVEKMSKGKIKVDTSKGMVRYIKESIINGKYKFNNVVNEELEPEDYIELREIIRAEIATIFFDLYKKKNVWAK